MHTLKYDNPARQWEEALPLGNGRTGAVITRESFVSAVHQVFASGGRVTAGVPAGDEGCGGILAGLHDRERLGRRVRA